MFLRFDDEKLPQTHVDIFTLIRDNKTLELIDYVQRNPEPCKEYIDDDKRTLLHAACELQSVELVKSVIDIAPNVNVVDSGLWTPLLIAVAGAPSNTELDTTSQIVDILLSKGADVKLMTKKKGTVFHYSRGRVDLLEKFYEKWQEGASQRDVYGNTPLHRAVASGNMKCVNFLLKHTKTVLSQNSMLKTPLHVACEEQNEEVVKLLIDNGADADMKDEDDKFAFPLISDKVMFNEICQYYKNRNHK
ncbi:ankyrin repeat-containing protein C6C3.08, putative [Entamoeba invadens IP1]|uniref:Ankyrin repeat-containing protein C6C3.08, putative n=1 Tax=Entamoeba invadens TaxID=33085 RepID=S0B2Y3_ENTIV|nr:ankyrin repeat-containing protein C6C3.08, putative [Entamoeba invadens IP1]ELP93294.1 ankyrin repeat-containing protein C6C3.08, putative [Entamoeba invadens IP1]BAN40881.1 ankyrin repeat-containing protein C6C3.08, putative [Entamoeba invadens]|eukprot:XP_004260065.1 ankyrin repeat-containing protein C6C3.08, putative [Entamoeba invadens IP1]